MTPQYPTRLDVHGQELSQAAPRCRVFIIPAPDRTSAALADHLLHRAEGRLLTGQLHRNVQSVRLRAVSHGAPTLESRRAGAHLKLHSDLWDFIRPIRHFARLGSDLHDVLIAEIRSVDELSCRTIELPENT